MDRRSWPWKKKSSDKDKAAAVAVDSVTSNASQSDQENYKKPSYVQISVESYSHLTGLEEHVKKYEEQVKTLDDEIKDLNEKLSTAQSEIDVKEELVKQHTKVAEEAVSGWEKAEAEALALKNHLESVTLLKLTAEDRAAHLDGALKECMRQIRNLKEDHELKLQEVVLTKSKQYDKMRLEFEAKMSDFEQELLKSAAENAALSRSLQERSNMLVKLSEEKSQAEAEIEHLKGNIEQCEREINSLKYELHIAAKELEIRNEEKNMSAKSAEVANKQHMEGVKKIAKLEAECQRLRGLVRKKLPGPAALAQMKHEVESWGRDSGDRIRRSPSKPSSPHLAPVTEFAMDNLQKFHKENEFLTERLLATEEETKMLKEALAKRNTELLASRNLCAKTVSKLQSLEAQLQLSSQQRNLPKSVVQIPAEGFSSQNGSNPPSLTFFSEDGNEDASTESWANALISELSQFKKKETEKLNKADNVKHLELMDDFLEMEKLACLPTNGNGNGNDNGAISSPDSVSNKFPETNNGHISGAVMSTQNAQSEQTLALVPVATPEADADQLPILKLRSKIFMAFESMPKDADVAKVLQDIKRLVEETHGALPQNCHDASSNEQSCPADCVLTSEKEISSSPDGNGAPDNGHSVSPDLAVAISQIHDFVLFLGKEAMVVHDSSPNGNGLSEKIEEFSKTFNKVLNGNEDLMYFVHGLSHVLTKASELRINVLGYKGAEVEISSPDCIDKVALPENKVVHKDLSGERYQNSCGHISNSASDPEVPDDGHLVPGFVTKTVPCSCKVSEEEFEELKLEKDNMAMDLARSTENLEATKSQLHETEQLLADIKSQLASAQKSNSLSETQLKCMAESYRSLETRTQELETELNILRAKTETLESQLEEEKMGHEQALARCKELEEQLARTDAASAVEIDDKTKQERELTAAAEKLAECQETILLLGKQLKALHPPAETTGSPSGEMAQKTEALQEDEPTTSGGMLDQAEADTAPSANVNKLGSESPIECYNSTCPSDSEANLLRSPISSKQQPKHRPTKSGSSSTSSTPTPDKQSRGFSRFFSAKGKNGHY